MPDDSPLDVLQVHDVREEDRRAAWLIAWLAAEVGALRADVQGLRAELTGRRNSRLSRDDYDMLAALLPVIGRAIHARTFGIGELFEHSKGLGESALRVTLADIGPHRLGRLFVRAQGIAVAGLTLETVGVDRGGRLWRICGEHRRDRNIDR